MLLDASEISVDFDGVRALDRVSLRVGDGRMVGLIGPNGAGKTTFIDAVTGFVPHAGRLTFDGRDLAALAPHQRVRAGLARTWQSVDLFDDLTVGENIGIVVHRPTARSVLLGLVQPSRFQDRGTIARALDSVGLADLADRGPAELSHGQRTLVGVARALAASARLVCMDEPAAGLDPAQSQALGQRLRRIVDDGTSVLLIDHDMGLVLTWCDEIYVIEFGRLIAHGPPAAIRNDGRVIAAYLGQSSSVDSGHW